MEGNNVMSWGETLSKNYEPRLYSYDVDGVPTGRFDAVLDFKVWAKKITGISCYFMQAGTGIKFQLTVYCQQGTGQYVVRGSAVDFAQCPTGVMYQVEVEKNEKGRIVFKAVLPGI